MKLFLLICMILVAGISAKQWKIDDNADYGEDAQKRTDSDAATLNLIGDTYKACFRLVCSIISPPRLDYNSHCIISKESLLNTLFKDMVSMKKKNSPSDKNPRMVLKVGKRVSRKGRAIIGRRISEETEVLTKIGTVIQGCSVNDCRPYRNNFTIDEKCLLSKQRELKSLGKILVDLY